jgi:hypothetical protein
MRRAWLLLTPLLLFVGACSHDDTSANGSTTTTLPPALSSTTLPAGAPDPNSLFPDTPIVAGQNATVNGAFSSGPNPDETPGSDTNLGCQWVTRSDGKKVAVQFPDVYASPDEKQFLIGPPNYTPGNDFDADPNLVHGGDKVIVAGEVDELDSSCTKPTSYPGLSVVSSVWSRKNA